MQSVDPTIDILYRSFDLIGVILNGIIGGTIARNRNYDIIGFVFLALFSATGGGMIRDMLISAGPAAAISDPLYLTLACAGALIAFLTDLKGKVWEIFKVHGDAIILGVWAITGTVKAIHNDLPLIACVFMGVITAIGGGMVRDVATGRIPTVFGGSPLYAVPAIVASVVMVAFHSAGYLAVGMIISPLVGTGLAIIAYWREWVLPRSEYYAPVNTTAAQFASAVKKAELRGFRRGREQQRKEDELKRDQEQHGNDHNARKNRAGTKAAPKFIKSRIKPTMPFRAKRIPRAGKHH